MISLFLWINAVDFAQWEAACCVKGKRVLQECILNSLVSGHMKFEPNQAVLHCNPRMSHFAMFPSDNYQLQTSSNICSNQPSLEAEFFPREVIHQNSEHSLSMYTQSCTCFFSTAKTYCYYFSKPRKATRLWFEQAVVCMLLINKTASDKVWCGNYHTHSWGFNTSSRHILFFDKTKKIQYMDCYQN